MDEDDKDLDPGGGGPEVIRAFIQSGRAGGVNFWGRDVGPDPPDVAGPEHISAHCRSTDHQEAAKAVGGGGWGISSAGSSDGGSGLRRYWGLRHEEVEYDCAIYCNATDSGPL